MHNTEWKKIVPILDINDNAPRFLTPEFSFDIFENVERGAFVGKIEAEDSDDNEKITYSFISDWGLDTFSIGKFNYVSCSCHSINQFGIRKLQKIFLHLFLIFIFFYNFFGKLKVLCI